MEKIKTEVGSRRKVAYCFCTPAWALSLFFSTTFGVWSLLLCSRSQLWSARVMAWQAPWSPWGDARLRNYSGDTSYCRHIFEKFTLRLPKHRSTRYSTRTKPQSRVPCTGKSLISQA